MLIPCLVSVFSCFHYATFSENFILKQKKVKNRHIRGKKLSVFESKILQNEGSIGKLFFTRTVEWGLMGNGKSYVYINCTESV
ncbi:hypothetical protein CJ195_15280 [Bacillus sp. UMB0899]|nr:hypothetical protein CJ195_15280 [Bacillus sp. UMB0899]